MPASYDDVARFLIEIRDLMETNQQALDALDAVAADGDHGATMVMGWRRVAAVASEAGGRSVGQLLKDAGAAFADVGGSIGPLWGTALLRAGRAVGDATAVDLPLALEAIASGVDGLAERGGSREGDKTLVDVMAPASRAFANAGMQTGSAEKAISAALVAATSGLHETVTLAAVRGRARRLSERSIGHADPGAASAYLIWRAGAEAITGTEVPNELTILLQAEDRGQALSKTRDG